MEWLIAINSQKELKFLQKKIERYLWQTDEQADVNNFTARLLSYQMKPYVSL